MLIKKKDNIKHYVIIIFIISVLINFVWEMAQMPFYYNYHFTFRNTLFCFIASLGDAVMILIIFFTGIFFLKDNHWIKIFNLKKILFTLTAGLTLAVIVELAALRLGLWSYSNLMTNLMFLGIGFSPVLQMLVLPVSVFQLTKLRIIRK